MSIPPSRTPAEMERERRQLPRRIHRLRMLGMALGGIAIAAVLHQHDAGWGAWAWLGFTALAWPQLAYAVASRSRDPYRAELRNLLVDSVLAGAWVPLLHFNLLPSVLVATLATVDKISSGVPRLWVKSLPGMAAGLLAAGLLTGFAFDPVTRMPVLLACLPLLLIHTIAVSLASYHLLRKVTRQNQLLDQLRRTDTLTGLYGRGYWREQAELALAAHLAGGGPAAVAVIDLDHFKQVNDGHGHGAGDEVLRAVAAAIRQAIRTDDFAGRLGGDEFAVLLPGAAPADAAATAERIRRAVRGTRLHARPGLALTVSIGVADAAGQRDLQAWLDAADIALYRAKHRGRDRVAIAEPAPAVDAGGATGGAPLPGSLPA